MASTPGPIPTRKPITKKITMKEIADRAHRGLPPESEERVYEFGNGTQSRKAGKGPYE